MCGFAGAVLQSGAPVNSQRVQAMGNTLAHRGPNHNGFWQCPAGRMAVAHRRLSVIDLSMQGAQPMKLGSLVVVYNGEIYNYPELKTELQQLGHQFHSQSDTEVLLAGYAAWGHGVLKKLDGAFAFAIWNADEHTLFAARDRFGEKPFFYNVTDSMFCFASEMKALWAGGISKEVNHAMLYNYLTLGYTTNPANASETFYKTIFKLPAASYLQLDAQNNTIIIERYWNLELREESNSKDGDALQQFDALLHDSVKKRLRSDVAIGTSLSGGLDSSAIVALCARHRTPAYSHNGFTAVFPNFLQSEETQASTVAAQFNLNHFQIPISASSALQAMDALAYHQEEPVSSASVLAQYLVFQKAREVGVTVLLDGQGADEVLGGYTKYYYWYWQQLYREKRLRTSGEYKEARAHGVLKKFGLREKTAALAPDFAAAMQQTITSKRAARNPYLHPDFSFANKQQSYYSLPHQPTLNGALYFNTVVHGLEELLRYADRNSMAHGVEVRLPFLQHQLVEFLFSLPPHFKIRDGFTKWILRKTMSPQLPHQQVWQTTKIGFEPPQKSWMQDKKISEKMQAGVESLVAQGILAPRARAHFIPTDAYVPDPFYWRFWSAACLWEK